MKKYMISFFLKILSVLLLPIFLSAESLWVDQNIYSSSAGYKVGDVLIVYVNDISTIKFSQNSSDKSNQNFSTNPDKTLTGFLPNVASDKSSSSNSISKYDGKNNIKISIAASVVSRASNGKLNIRGSKLYQFNGVNTSIQVRGNVDPIFIDGRGIDAGSVSNFTIIVSSSKKGIKLNRPALKPEEKASVDLNENEKNRIVIDYLQKVLGELTR